MPPKGFHVITINDDLKEQLTQIADKKGLSIQEVISKLLDLYRMEA